MKHFYILLLACAISFVLPAQNLVPNPSFESWTSCPGTGGGVARINNWNPLAGHGGSPDAFHPCGGNGSSFGAPGNVFGTQTARTGQTYMGFVTYFVIADWREYFQVQLTQPLTAGVTYQVEAYFSLSDGSGYGTDGYDFYFSNNALSATGSAPLTYLTPQVQNPSGNNITNKTGWSLVSGSFVAAGGERFLTIGNFQNDANTSFSVVTGWTWNYSYIDDVSVTPSVVLSAEMGELKADWGNGPYSRLEFDAENEQGVARYIIERSVGDLENFEPIEKIEARGGMHKRETYALFDHDATLNRSNFYRVRVENQDGSTAYGNTVELAAYQSEDYVVRLFPNPIRPGNEAQLMLHLATEQEVTFTVADLSGKIIRTESQSGMPGMNRFTLPTTELPAGYYLVKYQTAELSGTEKLVVE